MAVAGMLDNGLVLITHRFMQGGKGWIGWWTQNFFAALTDQESCRARRREDAHTRVLPLDFDRHPDSEAYPHPCGYPDANCHPKTDHHAEPDRCRYRPSCSFVQFFSSCRRHDRGEIHRHEGH